METILSAVSIIRARLNHIDNNVIMDIASMLMTKEDFAKAIVENEYSDFDLVHDLSGMLKPNNEFFVPRIY